MKNSKERPPVGLAGRNYDSVNALMRGEGMTKEVQDKVSQFASETRITLQLAQLRQTAGITQKQMADALGVTQSAISKLESGKDEDLTLKDIREYSRITGERISLMCGKPYTHAEAIKLHAAGLKIRLEQLASLAVKHDDLQSEIKGFLGEAFFNLFNIVTLCSEKLPQGENDLEVRVEILQCGTHPNVSTFNIKTPAPTEIAA